MAASCFPPAKTTRPFPIQVVVKLRMVRSMSFCQCRRLASLLVFFEMIFPLVLQDSPDSCLAGFGGGMAIPLPLLVLQPPALLDAQTGETPVVWLGTGYQGFRHEEDAALVLDRLLACLCHARSHRLRSSLAANHGQPVSATATHPLTCSSEKASCGRASQW